MQKTNNCDKSIMVRKAEGRLKSRCICLFRNKHTANKKKRNNNTNKQTIEKRRKPIKQTYLQTNEQELNPLLKQANS